MREKFIAKVGEVTVEFNLLNLRNGKILKNSDNYNYRGFSVFFLTLNVTAVLRKYYLRGNKLFRN